jgi:hypothetical protein
VNPPGVLHELSLQVTFNDSADESAASQAATTTPTSGKSSQKWGARLSDFVWPSHQR